MTAAPLTGKCTVCGIPCSACNLCPEHLLERTVAERAAQGLPPTIEDPVILRRLAYIAATATKREAS